MSEEKLNSQIAGLEPREISNMNQSKSKRMKVKDRARARAETVRADGRVDEERTR